MTVESHVAEAIAGWKSDWNRFARDVLGVRLDEQQQEIVHSCQVNPRTVVRSGHARGKDFTSGVVTICHHFLNYPSKTILTAPTDRQAVLITLAEAKRRWMDSRVPLGGEFLQHMLVHRTDPDWYVLAFKAADRKPEDWTGFHSPKPMVIITEASGVEDETFDAIEGLLTGDSRLLLVMNPNRTTGRAYQAFKSQFFNKFTLSCLEAPNVKAGKVIVPGQVDWDWVNVHVHMTGWTLQIPASEANPDDGDFQWDSRDGRGLLWYKPSDPFRIKVLGLWPKEAEGQLIPLAWVEAAQQRHRDWQASGGAVPDVGRRVGADIAGMGNDLTVFCLRYDMLVPEFLTYAKSDHMATVGRLRGLLRDGDVALVDTIGEGAGVYSRGQELGLAFQSVKFSAGAENLRDLTGERTFKNLRAYCWWAIRDALDPELGGKLMLPEIDELTQDLTAPRWSVDSQNRIIIEPKDDIKDRLKRSPDFGDALALTFAPDGEAVAVGGWDVSPQ